MRAPVVTPNLKPILALLALLLACASATMSCALRASAEGLTAGPTVLASSLASGELRVSADMALAGEGDLEPIVGSFVADGLTYAVIGEGEAALVAVGPGTLAGSLAEGMIDGFEGGSDAVSADSVGEPTALAIPGIVEHGGAAYAVTSIGSRAFAGCAADVVFIPATVGSVDESAFRGSAVASVEVAEGNPHYSSYDGMLFDADQLSLLLIPEGKQGAARIPKTAEVVPPSAFSHCAGVTAIDVEAGSAAFSSRNGSLYDASGETLLWAPPVISLQVAETKALPYIGHVVLDANGGILESKMSYEDDTNWRKHFAGTWEDDAHGTNWTLACDGRFDYRPPNQAVNYQWAQVRVSRAGYRILGWQGSVTCLVDGTVYIEGTGDLSVAAVWEPKTFTVWFNPHGGVGGQSTLAQRMDDELPNVAVPSREGYIFTGYYDDPDAGNRYFDGKGRPVNRGEGYGTRWTWPADATMYAHWIPLLSIDVPGSATFFADMIQRGQGSRDAQVKGVFGTGEVRSRSSVALSVVGLRSESSAVASDILTGVTDEVLSVYPAERLLTDDEARASELSPSSPRNAISFSLDDELDEHDFEGKGFIVPAGGSLFVGYRLNLAESGAQIDFAKLPQQLGDSATLASISYVFCAID